MITNIVAAVTVLMVTNHTEILPKHMVSDPVPMGPNGEVYAVFYGHWENDKDPKEKWLKTEIAEIHTLSLDFDGYKCNSVYQIVKTNWTVHMEKNDSWGISKTNTPPP